MTKITYAKFGEAVWKKLCAQPLGTLTKRELELTLLRSDIEYKLLEPRAEKLAAT